MSKRRSRRKRRTKNNTRVYRRRKRRNFILEKDIGKLEEVSGGGKRKRKGRRGIFKADIDTAGRYDTKEKNTLQKMEGFQREGRNGAA